MFIHCKNISGVLVPVGYDLEAPKDQDLPVKKSDMVTGDISIDKHDLNLNVSCYTGTNEDGSTDGTIEHKRYLHLDALGNIVGEDFYMIDGVVQPIPEKRGDHVTGPISSTNAERVNRTYNGTLEDGSTDGSIV